MTVASHKDRSKQSRPTPSAMSTEPDPASELTAEDYYYGGGADYDPEAYVPYWHQRMELITICVCNGLTRELRLRPRTVHLTTNANDGNGGTVLTICARIWIRRATLKRFRADDYWMIAAGVGPLAFAHRHIFSRQIHRLCSSSRTGSARLAPIYTAADCTRRIFPTNGWNPTGRYEKMSSRMFSVSLTTL